MPEKSKRKRKSKEFPNINSASEKDFNLYFFFTNLIEEMKKMEINYLERVKNFILEVSQ